MSWNNRSKIRLLVLICALVIIPTIAAAQSWNYREVDNIGYWSWGSTDRFKYDYGAQQWYDTTTFGGWQKLGEVGQSAANRSGVSDPNFVGNGSWHTVGTGLSYRYVSGGDYSNWVVNGNMRFAYTYGTGLWADYYWGTNTWSLVGSAGLSSAFLGDGGWHTVGTGLSYKYVSIGDYSNWLVNGNMRYAYTYGNGLWADYSPGATTWSLVGSAGLSSSFLGDGGWHTVATGLSYRYESSGDYSNWLANGNMRFAYTYSTGQWADYYWGTNTWSLLGSAGISSAFVGDGGWHSLGGGLSYWYTTSGDYSNWLVNGNMRFAYTYSAGLWADYYGGTNTWSVVGSSGLSSAFIGDGGFHPLNNGWSYQYVKADNDAYWKTGSSTRFYYDYDLGQWWDNTVSGWGRLGVLGGMSSQFIGDGNPHAFATSVSFLYSPSDDYYYWKVNGTSYYRYNFASQIWSNYFNGSWHDYMGNDCRFLYQALFVERRLMPDTGSYAPSGRQELQYELWNGASGWQLVTSWTIHNPGSDNTWSGGDLNIAWGNTRHWDGSSWVDDFNQRYGEFTKEDVIFFAADFEQNPIGFATMVDWMTYVRDYFGKQISTVQVNAHGNTTGWEMGQWMDTSNYTSFQTDWYRWGSLMTDDGQIVSIHCQVGNAWSMLNQIAAWSGCDIYANTNETWTVWWWLHGSGENTSYWNANYNNVTWYDNSSTTKSRFFEYTTTGLQDYRWLLSL